MNTEPSESKASESFYYDYKFTNYFLLEVRYFDLFEFSVAHPYNQTRKFIISLNCPK